MLYNYKIVFTRLNSFVRNYRAEDKATDKVQTPKNHRKSVSSLLDNTKKYEKTSDWT